MPGMGEDLRARLRAEIGGDAVEGLRDLEDADIAKLLAALLEARSAERRALRDAAESSLGIVPRFARGAVRKIVFG